MYVGASKNLKSKKTYVIMFYYTIAFFVQNNYITMGGMDVNFWGIPLNWSNSTTI